MIKLTKTEGQIDIRTHTCTKRNEDVAQTDRRCCLRFWFKSSMRWLDNLFPQVSFVTVLFLFATLFLYEYSILSLLKHTHTHTQQKRKSEYSSLDIFSFLSLVLCCVALFFYCRELFQRTFFFLSSPPPPVKKNVWHENAAEQTFFSGRRPDKTFY